MITRARLGLDGLEVVTKAGISPQNHIRPLRSGEPQVTLVQHLNLPRSASIALLLSTSSRSGDAGPEGACTAMMARTWLSSARCAAATRFQPTQASGQSTTHGRYPLPVGPVQSEEAPGSHRAWSLPAQQRALSSRIMGCRGCCQPPLAHQGSSKARAHIAARFSAPSGATAIAERLTDRRHGQAARSGARGRCRSVSTMRHGPRTGRLTALLRCRFHRSAPPRGCCGLRAHTPGDLRHAAAPTGR